MTIRLLPTLLALMLGCTSPVILAQDEDEEDFFVFDDEETSSRATIADPLEGYNRAMFSFNDKAYRYFLKPIARGLRAFPEPVRIGADNFFTNLRTPISAAAALLQGDLRNAGSEAGRFLINSTVGIVGILDPATDVGLIRDEEDFGQTLGRWGVGPGIYIVMPFMGPTSLRDLPATIGNNTLNPIYANLHDDEMIAINVVSAEIALSLDKDSYEAFYRDALDPYVFFRSAWAQNRQGRIAR